MNKKILVAVLLTSNLLAGCNNAFTSNSDASISNSESNKEIDASISNSESNKEIDDSIKLLKTPSEVEKADLLYSMTPEFKSYKNKLNKFSSRISSKLLDKEKDSNENIAISPLSIFMALSLVTACSANNTQKELLDAFDMSYDELIKNTKYLYEISSKYLTNKDGEATFIEQLTNSIWINNTLNVKENCLEDLANNLYCYPYWVDFYNKNAETNKYIQEFVSEKTYGMINQNFHLSPYTLLTLINTLYIKDLWVDSENGLKHNGINSFKNKDNTITNTDFYETKYFYGQVIEEDKYSYFSTQTNNGLKLKFILPKENESINEIMNASNIASINSRDNYLGRDEENNTTYYTRAIFPEFEASYGDDIKGLVSSEFNIKDLFSDADFTPLIDTEVYCSSIIHKTKLEVNKKGIEGAAVTIVETDGCATIEPQNIVYCDFVVDKSFGYILTDSYNNPLFTGIVNKI